MTTRHLNSKYFYSFASFHVNSRTFLCGEVVGIAIILLLLLNFINWLTFINCLNKHYHLLLFFGIVKISDSSNLNTFTYKNIVPIGFRVPSKNNILLLITFQENFVSAPDWVFSCFFSSRGANVISLHQNNKVFFYCIDQKC